MASNSIIQYRSSSSSSSSPDLIRRYDVFVSFRGDTRNNFTDHLFAALRRNSINFFRDDTKLKKGKHILPELLQAIEGSQILVVVFSKKYASSKWCLRELEKIATCTNVEGKHVLPIFYDVTPSEVRNQSGDYKEAFDDYQERFKEDKEKMKEMKRWRKALSQVGNLSGWDIGNKPQSKEIEKIVQDIQKRLPTNIVSFRTDELVGIELPVEKLEKLLLWNSVDDVMSIGICGMAGMGKTALVNAVCNRIHHYFEFNYFVEDMSKICENFNVHILRKYLLGQDPEENSLILESYNVLSQTNSVSNGRRLIVLDNVGHIEQLEKLNLDHKFLNPGSRIIIISKDKRILEDYGVNHVYHVEPLNDDNALELFYKYAFKVNNIMSEYEKVEYDILSYCEGHPLLIKVLGRHLACQKDVLQWKSAIAKLRESPKKDILDKLRISFDGLEQNEKEIFLDIACFYEWYRSNGVLEVLQFRGFEVESGLKALHEKSLITYDNKWVDMPRLLIDLGKYIVKEKSPKEPREWSRLWDCQDLLKVLVDNKASKNLEAIIVERYGDDFSKTMKVDALSKMTELKMLKLYGVKFSGSLNYLSNELGYLIWKGYPFKCLPLNFQPNNLIKLVMENSNIKRLWKGTKALPNLKCLDLHQSKNLVKMPNFEKAPNLQCLNFQGCIQLRKIHASVGSLRELTFLNLEDCISLVSLPTSLLGLSSLKFLNLMGCTKLYSSCLLEEARDTKHFNKPWIGEAHIHFPSTSSIKEESFMYSASSLLSSPTFPYMRYLDLSFCNLHQIPVAIGNLCCLEKLNLMGNKFEKVPSLKKLWKLVYINLEHCKKLKYLFELPSQTDLTSGMYLPPREISISRVRHLWEAGLHIFNCADVVENEKWSRMTISWMMQIVKTRYHQFGLAPWIESVIPGNEIPKWFNNHHVAIDNTISIDGTPLKQDDNNWNGLALCVVFCVSHHGENSNPTKRQPKDVILPMHLDMDLVTDKSDHMYLFYFARNSRFFFLRQYRLTMNSDEMMIDLGIVYPDWDIEVKKYGYLWVYESDLHLSNIPSSHSNNQSKRKRKFLEIKEKQ